MSDNKKTIQISEELYNAIQDLKTILSQLTGEEIKSDEDVIGILISGFLESLAGLQHQHQHPHSHHDHQEGQNPQQGGGIILDQ